MVTKHKPSTEALFALRSDLAFNGRPYEIHWTPSGAPPREAGDIIPGFKSLKKALGHAPLSCVHQEIDAATRAGSEWVTAPQAETIREMLREAYGPEFPVEIAPMTAVLGATVPLRDDPAMWTALRIPGSEERVGMPIDGLISGLSPHEIPSNPEPPRLYVMAAILPDPTGTILCPTVLYAHRSTPVCDWQYVGSWASLTQANPEQAQAATDEFFTSDEALMLQERLAALGHTAWVEPVPIPLNFRGLRIADWKLGGLLSHGSATLTAPWGSLTGFGYVSFADGPGVEWETGAAREAAKEHIAAIIHAAGYPIPDEQTQADIAAEVASATGLRSVQSLNGHELEVLRQLWRDGVLRLAGESERRASLPMLLAWHAYRDDIGEPGASALDAELDAVPELA